MTTANDVLKSIGITGENELFHYGKVGMKWGQRKARGSNTVTSTRTKGKFDKKAPKKLNKMSDAELKKIISRMQMEKQYGDLTRPKPNAGKQFVKELLIGVGKTQATKYANQIANDQIAKIIAQTAAKAAAKKAAGL